MAKKHHRVSDWEEYWNFDAVLSEDGIVGSRIPDLFKAFNQLHRAIARLDLRQRRIFWDKTLEERLVDFAESEDVLDVVPDDMLED
jgi:hypothetical protein